MIFERKDIMKKMLKAIITIIVVGLLFPINAFAEDDKSLYAYTNYDVEIENYAKEKVTTYMNSHYDNRNVNNLELGEGIKIFTTNNENKILYPIWENDTIVATFIVGKESEQFYAVYSEAYIDQLNFLSTISSISSPIYIVANENGIFGVIDDKWYNLNENIGNYEYEEEYFLNDKLLINSFEKVEVIPYIQTRIPTSYSKSFTIYQSQGSGSYCYSYALGNILMNMGYSSYTPANIQAYMNYSSGASKSDLSNYLNSKGLTCNYGEYGYLSFNDVMTLIYNSNSYIYIGARSNNRNVSHAFVIYGYFNNGSTQLYNFWNPWYNYKQTMSAGNRIIETGSSETFTWNNGYLYNIR